MAAKPTIYLNPTDDSDNPVMLHDGTCRRGSFRGSLPDLKTNDDKTAANSTILGANIRGYNNAKDRRLEAYCSPCFRSRKTFKSLDLEGYDDSTAHWHSTSPVDKNNVTWSQYLCENRTPRMLGRSCSSLGSFDSAQVLIGQSISNLSICGSRNLEAIDNITRLSLPDLRSYHNLEIHRMCVGLLSGDDGKCRYFAAQRGVKSCSNLPACNQTGGAGKLKSGNLLSPQSLMKSPYRSLSMSTSPSVESTDEPTPPHGGASVGADDAPGGATAREVIEAGCKNREIYDSVYTETRYEKDKRIRRWLKNLSAQSGDRVLLDSDW